MEFEQNIVGCLLIKPELIKELIVPKECFITEEAKISIQIIDDQYNKYKTISLVGLSKTYAHLFKNNIESKQVVDYLNECMLLEATANNFSYYQEQLFKTFVRNKIINTIEDYKTSRIDTDTLLENIHKFENMTLNEKDYSLNSGEIYHLITEESKKIKFRFPKLTLHANIQEHDLIILAARPGVGKTAFALNLMENISDEYNCVYFNCEMAEQQIFRRLLSIHSQMGLKYIESRATEYQDSKLKEFCDSFSKKKIKVITASQTLNTLRSTIIRESKSRHTIFFIDYVGLIGGKDKQSNYERITEITKELRRLSLDYNCTIFLISQLNRASENKKDKRPNISDLKESGELEQSGTSVLMLHTDNIYNNKSDDKEEVQLIIGKNRNGRVGLIKYEYDKGIQRFEEK